MCTPGLGLWQPSTFVNLDFYFQWPSFLQGKEGNTNQIGTLKSQDEKRKGPYFLFCSNSLFYPQSLGWLHRGNILYWTSHGKQGTSNEPRPLELSQEQTHVIKVSWLYFPGWQSLWGIICSCRHCVIILLLLVIFLLLWKLHLGRKVS